MKARSISLSPPPQTTSSPYISPSPSSPPSSPSSALPSASSPATEDTSAGVLATDSLPPSKPSSPSKETSCSKRTSSSLPGVTEGVGCVGVMWAYGCGCRLMWVRALVRIKRGARVRQEKRRHSLLDFMRLQRHAFLNNLPQVFTADMVTREEVEKLVHVQIPNPESFHPDFCSFRYFPRQLAESSTPLAVVSMLDHLGFITRWHIRRDTLARFTLMVRKGYRDPPYHNWIHAFSVTHFAFLTLHNLQLTATKALTDLEALALIFSSLCHDLDHRGTTNSFQVASNSVLASLYSSEGSVMERHHLAQTMCILNTQDCNVFENLSQQQYTQCLDLMRDIILATDLAHHLRLLGEMREMARRGYNSSSARHHHLLTCLLMTAADLSDQTKDWVSSKRVAELIYKEFFTQGDLEKAMGNMPLEMMDREKAFIPELQLQFVDEIALPVYEILSTLFPLAAEPYESVKANRRNWARLRDVYKRRKHESTSSLEVFEDDSSLEEELAAAVLKEEYAATS